MEPYQNPALSPEERAEDLLGRMALREKVGQLTQRLYGFAVYTRQGDQIELTEEFRQEVDRYSGLGTLYGLYRADPWSGRDFDTGLDGVLAPKARNLAQKYVLDHSRLGIPMLMSSECPHGHQALDGFLLPVNLACGASWNPELLGKAAEISGSQLRRMGVDLALVSALDVLRDPRWGRSEECFGEDPLLASRMAGAVVRGMQSQGIDVVAKHLCAQGETTGGVNASAARIGRRELREIHLPPVKACVEAGVSGFMAAYNEIDGVYCHANRWLLTELLREEYGFKGFVMSDGVAIDQLDAMTGDRTVSGAVALSAGVDMGLWDTGFQQLEEAVERGLVTEAQVDAAVKRILLVKFRRGLFEHPYVEEDDGWRTCPGGTQARQELTRETMVLLKNQGNALPLDAAKIQRLAVVGPNADSLYHQLGDYTPPLRPGEGVTPLAGIEAVLGSQGSGAQVVYRRGCGLFDGDSAELAEAARAAAVCDGIVAVLGGSSSRFAGGEFDANGALKHQREATMDCGENVDDSRICIPGAQLELLRALKATGRPVVTVLIGGRPYEMEEIHRLSDGILCCFYPGPAGGTALAELLFGGAEPSGRLPASLPDHRGQLPVYYNAKDSYRPLAYYDGREPVTYGFGSGMGYTEFAWTLIQAPADGERRLTLAVTNTGGRRGCAVPQLYIHRAQGVTTARWRQLCDFCKVWLEPGQCREVTLEISRESLTQWDSAMRPVCPPGRIEWFLCDSGKTQLTGTFVSS